MGGGGAERVALTLMTFFAEEGYEVDLVLLRAEGELLRRVPEAVHIINLNARRIAGALLPLVRYYRRRKPDAVQIRMWPLTVIGLIAHRLARSHARVVVSDHVALSDQYGHLPRTFAILRATVRLIYPLADQRILVSAGAADDLAQISGLSRAQFRVVYNPLPPALAPNITPEIEALWGEAEGRIISVGSLKPEKNHALLIRSFALLRRRRPVKLMLVGAGELRQTLEEQAACEGVTGDVIFTGFCEDPSGLVASADLFVLSSNYEGFGNVLVEAMRHGVSVVSTDCRSGPREILDDGRFGRLVPCGDVTALADAMAAELDNPRDRVSLMRRADAISGESVIQQYREMLLGRSLDTAIT